MNSRRRIVDPPGFAEPIAVGVPWEPRGGPLRVNHVSHNFRLYPPGPLSGTAGPC
jgi:hypothetical protein